MFRYNWHSAGSLGWPFPMLKYKYIFEIKYTEAMLSNGTRKLSWFEISKMLIALKKLNSFVIYCNFRHTIVPCGNIRVVFGGQCPAYMPPLLFYMTACARLCSSPTIAHRPSVASMHHALARSQLRLPGPHTVTSPPSTLPTLHY